MSSLTARAASFLLWFMMPLAETQAQQHSVALSPPSDVEIRAILAERVDTLAGKSDGVGIVVGVIGPQGRRVIAYGHRNQGDSRPLDGHTVFEIGSVSKVFTALLLADTVRKGEVSLADPVEKYLPGLKIPGRSGRSITLLDLATHTSGLPFMPEDLPSAEDSPSKYGAGQIYQFVARYQLTRDIGTQWDYSNIGYWLLAQALANRARTNYESLVRARIITPLRLKNTAISLSPQLQAKLAAGHNAVLQPAASFSSVPGYAPMLDVLNLVSTADDLLSFLSAAMGYERSELAPAMSLMLRTRRPMPQPGETQALGWVVEGEGDNQLIAHDGGTLGYASSVAWDPKKRLGIVVLSNQLAGVGDIARHLLRPTFPLQKPVASLRREIALDAAVLDTYTGRYEAQGEGLFLVVRERDFLTIQLPPDWGLPKMRLHPESQREFFATELPLRVTFQADADGRIIGMLVFPPRGQQAVPAKRFGSDHP
jgi:CubicO group peptidase (beta-lactamase class C family)